MRQLINNQPNSLSVGIIIVLLVAMGQFNNTLFMPSLPHMSEPLNTSITTLQLSVTLTLFAFGVSQLFYGPFSDYYGRRPAILIGLLIFFVGNVICTLAAAAPMLLIGKFITGLGVGCVGPVARAIIRDLSSGQALLKLMGTLVMFMSITPAISPMLGGIIQGYLGWRMNFLALSIIALFFLLYAYAKLPETNKDKNLVSNRLALPKMIANYLEFFLHGEFLRMALFNMLGYAAELVFLLSASYILQNHFKVPAQLFGSIPLMIVPCVILGNFTVTKLSKRVNAKMICMFGISLMLIGSLLMYICSSIMPSSMLSFFLPMMVVALGEGIVTPTSTAKCMDLYGAKAGYAGAMVGAIAMMGAGTVIGFLSANSLHTVTEVAIVLIALSIISITLCFTNLFFKAKEV